MLKVAIYLRAGLTLLHNVFHKLYLPLLDAALMFLGLWWLIGFWARTYHKDAGYYDDLVYQVNVPLYILLWLGAVYFSGGYDRTFKLRRLVRGLLLGTLLIAAVYGFLEMPYRFSRAIILLGALWAVISLTTLRMMLHFLAYRNFRLGEDQTSNLVIVGSEEESRRVRDLLYRAQVQKNFIGTVAPRPAAGGPVFLSGIDSLGEVVRMYKVNEIIFCSSDLRHQDILNWMSRLGPQYNYKILPQEGLSIIGSHSKNTPGELYTVDISFRIASPTHRRYKRMLDIGTSLLLFFLSPLFIWITPRKKCYFPDIFRVLLGRNTWVGYTPHSGNLRLPKLRPGIFSPLHALRTRDLPPSTIERLNFFYAKDYRPEEDLEIIWKGLVSIKE